ncbi:GNAT family N-acetyltransferase [Plantactinospora sp. WMMC1484]|uniref:GNAT family N-acetyltransferase n=1 Tax=Plantactinospora sp. WMMC1484 TaxID=3404122 RepID=UPI003BF554F3
MPLLVPPVLPADSLRTIRQPRLDAAGGLELRPWRATDAATVREAFGCPQIQRWHLRRMDSDAEACDWTAQWPERWVAGTDASWAVVEERSDRPLGQVGLREIRLEQASAELSYWVLPVARGQGLAGRAVRALQAWAFDRLGLHRLDLRHSTANHASCRVAGKLGFPVEGTLRGAWRHADGWHDVHLHARLRDERPHAGCGR